MILDAAGNPVAGAEPWAADMTEEITSRFSGKIQCERFDPRMKYESREFFLSYRTQCRRGEEAQTAERAYEFCRSEVLREMAEYAATLKSNFEATSWKRGAA